MEYLYAALLLHKAGKKITEDNIKKTLKAAGAKADDARIKATVSALKDVDVEKVIAETTVATPAKAAPEPSEKESPKKKDEKKKEKEDEGASEEEAAEGLGALFG